MKVNADENQELVAQMGVRSLPAVKLFKDGEVVDEFTGVLPEEAIRQFINKHRSRQTEPYRQQALALQNEGKLDDAIDLMSQVLHHESDFHEAGLELAAMYLARGDVDQAETQLQGIPDSPEITEQMKQLRADIKMARLQQEASGEDTSALAQKLADHPDDLATMLELARLYIAQGNTEEGLELYLSVMKKDAGFQERAGHQGLIETFELLGGANPLVKQYRGKMFSLLY